MSNVESYDQLIYTILNEIFRIVIIALSCSYSKWSEMFQTCISVKKTVHQNVYIMVATSVLQFVNKKACYLYVLWASKRIFKLSI